MELIDVIIAFLGVSYVFLWSIGFYFQAYLIHKLKYSGGYSLDFQILNIIGYIFLSINNINFVVANNGSYDTWIDLFFPTHALLISLVILSQSWKYPKGINRGNISVYFILGVILIMTMIFQPLNCEFSTCNPRDLYVFMGLTKTVISMTKNTYKVFLSYDNRTTYGFSQTSVKLDIVGSVMSLIQMVLIIYFKQQHFLLSHVNWPKVTLSIQSLAFDVIFMTQDNVLGTGPTPEMLKQKIFFENKEKIEEEEMAMIEKNLQSSEEYD